MPFMFCNLNNVCSYAENNDDSIWLTTGEPMPMSMTPIPSRELEKYISRCAVCETTTRLIALHSQSMEIPDCPQGWEESWIGYSYYMQTSDAHGNSHQNLISPGSCMEEFRAQPVIECHGRGTCNIFDGITSFWLTVIEDSEQFKTPRQQTLKADQTSKISRCSVCRKIDRSFRERRPSTPLPNASALLRPEQQEIYPSRGEDRFDVRNDGRSDGRGEVRTDARGDVRADARFDARGDIRGDIFYDQYGQPQQQTPPPPRRRRPNSRQNQQRARSGQVNNRQQNNVPQ